MKKTFHQSSYLSQVRQLRGLAKEALTLYKISVRKTSFIHHGENATFCVEAKNGKKYLLRIHRNDYHTVEGIQEELNWLAQVSKKLQVPNPFLSKKGRKLESIVNENFPLGRNISVFHWIEGKPVRGSVTIPIMSELGKLIAQIQAIRPKSPVRHRRYWDAEGLVGKKPKFGSLEKLPGVRAKDQKILNAQRSRIYKKLIAFGKRFPKRMALIHADLHFGNLISTKDGLAAIDFDDCGYGFLAYDLAVPLYQLTAYVDRKDIPHYREALIQGYSSMASWDRYDDEILVQLTLARRLVMLGWLSSRSDNPRLKRILKIELKKFLEEISLQKA